MKYNINILFATLFMVTVFTSVHCQDYKIVTVGFYNLENLFDTEDDPFIRDEEFTPTGDKAWTDEKYQEKLTNMAYVISQIGIDVNPNGLSVLGVSEVENKRVLEDLVAQKSLEDNHFEIIHYDSPDRRGIDVAMLFNPKHFIVLEHDTIPLKIYNSDGTRRFTRNILWVKGILDSDTTHIMVNHWPSRSGGEARSAPNRIKGAYLCRQYIDSIFTHRPTQKVIVMGDLNDDPTSKSVRNTLRAKYRAKETGSKDMFNPMADYYRRGLGSNAYRDSWSLFDQIIISGNWLNNKQDGYFYHKAYVFNKKFLVQPTGKYKGYPFRTFSGDRYQGGYSDHFPVYSHFLKRVEQ